METTDETEIRPWFQQSSLSPLLQIGDNLAFFQSSGKIHERNERLDMCVIIGAVRSLESLRIFAGILSRPNDIDPLRLVITLITSSTIISLNLNSSDISDLYNHQHPYHCFTLF